MPLPGMPWYVPTPPRPELARLVACSWTAAPTGEHRLVPDGCIDVLWVSTGLLLLCGPETEAWTFRLPARSRAVGVRLRPGVAPLLFGFDASRLRNRRVRLETLVGGAEIARLAVDLDGATGSDDRRHRLESYIEMRAGTRPVDLRFADAVIDQLVARPRATLAEVAGHVGLTVRQVHRRSLVSFGYGTKLLARLLRFQRFLALGVCDPGLSLTGRAVAAGYSDQAHLARDCRAITGLSPTAFLDDYFPTFPRMSDPFKTEQPLVATMGR